MVGRARFGALGHEVRLIPPAYVKPFVKRQKNDMADAEAICEAAQRPTMRFVAPKSAEKQASGMVFRTRDLLVRQTDAADQCPARSPDGVRIIAPQGRISCRPACVEVENVNSHLPSIAIELCTLPLETSRARRADRRARPARFATAPRRCRQRGA